MHPSKYTCIYDNFVEYAETAVNLKHKRYPTFQFRCSNPPTTAAARGNRDQKTLQSKHFNVFQHKT